MKELRTYMLQRDQQLLEQRQRIIKQSDKKFWAKFVRTVNGEELSFKVWIDWNENNSFADAGELVFTSLDW